jgi:hypothetical protein
VTAMQVTTTKAFQVYWNYQVWNLAKGETVSGGLADYLVATSSPVEEIPTGPADEVPDDEPEAPDEAVDKTLARALEAPAEEEPEGPAVDIDGDGVPDGTVGQVQEWVGDDPDRAARAFAAEKAKGEQARTTLVAALDKLLTH